MENDFEFRVELLTWPRLAAAAPGRIGLLPVGAATKEHGRHLPLGADAMQVEWLAGELAQRLPVLVWPTVGYGYYPAFARYPGSPTLDQDAFVHALSRVLQAMSDSGHGLCVILNGGVSTIAGVNRACAGYPACRPLHIYSGPAWRRAAKALSRQQNGGHADQLETSVIMHLASELVDIDLAEDASEAAFRPGPLNPDRPGEPNYSPSGAMGNPTLADAETGRLLCRAMLADALAALRPSARVARMQRSEIRGR